MSRHFCKPESPSCGSNHCNCSWSAVGGCSTGRVPGWRQESRLQRRMSRSEPESVGELHYRSDSPCFSVIATEFSNNSTIIQLTSNLLVRNDVLAALLSLAVNQFRSCFMYNVLHVRVHGVTDLTSHTHCTTVRPSVFPSP